MRIEVPYINQSEKYPTGCESVTAVMLLRFLGFEIGVDEFIDNYLEKQDYRMCGGVWYGPDPREKFVGSPYDADSMGCYAPVICKALKAVLGEGYEVIDETGRELPVLAGEYLECGMPLIVWNSINLREPVAGPEWRLWDSGEIFTWVSNEHCMLLVGEEEDVYIFNDPYENNGVISYPKEVILDRYPAYHSQAVGIRKKK